MFELISTRIKELVSLQDPPIPSKTLMEPSLDGAIADKCHHTVLFDNETIRIIDVIVPSMEDEHFHTHEFPSVMYVDKPARIEYHTRKGLLFASPEGEQRQPSVSFLSPEEEHKVTNIDREKAYTAFRIEVKFEISEKNQEIIKELKNIIEEHRNDFDNLRHKSKTYTPLANSVKTAEKPNLGNSAATIGNEKVIKFGMNV